MKLVEIKNSLAKLYYQPADFPLVLSDFLTIDDTNQKLLSQVVSIESTSKENTNCAILKFSLDLSEQNIPSTYSGYTPALDAKVQKTPADVLNKIFANGAKTINLGQLTNTSNCCLELNSSLHDKYLYIQADRQDEAQKLVEKITAFNNEKKQKTLIIDFENAAEYTDANILELGKEFKLPIDNNTLNYIYENDLTGLTVEQKTIVQDIILEIQDYIDSIDTGYIPFDTLLSVVNEIYETDKSVGVILFRNKLLKYHQTNIFASKQEEIDALEQSIKNNVVTVLKATNISTNWQKEALAFVVNCIDDGFYLVFKASEEYTDKQILNKIAKAENIRPVIISKYDYDYASAIKAVAQNLILFRPEEQQRAFATYNSFLLKLAQKEFIVSGEASFYTPLIVKEAPEHIEEKENILPAAVSSTEDNNQNTASINTAAEEQISLQESEPAEIKEEEIIDELEAITDDDEHKVEEVELLSPEEDGLELLEDLPELEEVNEESSELKNIFEESLEQEIAKDVDQMFYADTSSNDAEEEISEEPELEAETEAAPDEEVNYNDMLEDSDLDLLDDLNNESEQPQETAEPEQEASLLDLSEDVPALEEEDLNILDDFDPLEELMAEEPLPEPELKLDDTENSEQTEQSEQADSQEDFLINDEEPQEEFEENNNNDFLNIKQEENVSGIPIYKTELDDKAPTDENIKVGEGNIVYHEKYGRGVVEELFKYGKRTLCSIQFDNVGRRLLDPNLAELKQM